MSKNERGFILALAMFGIVALTVVGMTSIFLASGEAEIAGNLRRQRDAQRCADAGLTALTAQLPSGTVIGADADSTPYSYTVNTGLVANKGHYNGYSAAAPSAAQMSASETAGVYLAGENVTNVASQGVETFRIVASCAGPNGAAAEESTAVMYRVSR